MPMGGQHFVHLKSLDIKKLNGIIKNEKLFHTFSAIVHTFADCRYCRQGVKQLNLLRN